MSMFSSAVQRSTLGLHTLEQYEPLIGAVTVERIAAKADRVRTMRVAHISSTFYGGGVTELLAPLTLMMNAKGIETDWHLIHGQDLRVGQQFVTPAIDPFSAKNRELSDREIRGFLGNYKIPTDRPLVTQISRFDRWKDPMGVIDAFRKASEQADCTLVLVGNNASDDPEGGEILETIKHVADEGIIVLAVDDPTLVNTLQRSAAIVLQKSTREGFGLTVTEAMWKGAAVIGGDVGGIRHQIKDEWNGFPVNTPEQAAARMVRLLKDPKLRKQVGLRAKESVRQNFLMSRLLENWLDLLCKYERPVI
jgi:trehalose synthase